MTIHINRPHHQRANAAPLLTLYHNPTTNHSGVSTMRLQPRLLVVLALALFSVPSLFAGEFPTGKFTNKGPDGSTWAISFDGKGKVTVFREEKEMVKLDYKVTKDEIEFSNETGEIADKDAKPGSYKWKLDGKKITFTKVKDDAEGRSQALTSGAWEKKD